MNRQSPSLPTVFDLAAPGSRLPGKAKERSGLPASLSNFKLKLICPSALFDRAGLAVAQRFVNYFVDLAFILPGDLAHLCAQLAHFAAELALLLAVLSHAAVEAYLLHHDLALQ